MRRRASLGLLPVAAVAALCAAPAQLRAQADLDAAETAADRGDVASARAALATTEASGETLTPAARTRLEFLRGRVAEDVDSAEVAYLRAAVEGAGPYAARARLRLAQLEIARGDHARATEHLERLRADDPGGPLEPASWVWTARAAELAGDATTSCRAWSAADEALPASDPGRELVERGIARCEEAAPQPGEVETFTVQLGAFGSEESATRLRDGAAEIGVAVRVESPSGGVRVYRVRAGRFGSRADAERLAERFRSHGFDAIVVPEEP